MPSKLTTGEIIGTVLGILSIITPLVIFFIKCILQARKKGATHRPETSDEESREGGAPPPPAPVTSGNIFHIREAHLSFYSESKPNTDAANPLAIAYPQAVLSRDTIGDLSTISNGGLSEMRRSIVHRIDKVNDNSQSCLNVLSTPDLESTQIAPIEIPSTPDPTSPPAGEHEKKAE
ncbi:uncharacterized protein H6S33_008474 [Morchella sextelata]|uniref:uncharacterized protein n=1 Tax=Morchella sextelata TaxID=1174677 RepID=UPI001D054473|nr:uncharacterized protein H6S33_008474 [Morchella sextelata]KAH0602824.1 hypothetical protein H6S33_008474 [Morchella sextelata]